MQKQSSVITPEFREVWTSTKSILESEITSLEGRLKEILAGDKKFVIVADHDSKLTPELNPLTYQVAFNQNPASVPEILVLSCKYTTFAFRNVANTLANSLVAYNGVPIEKRLKFYTIEEETLVEWLLQNRVSSLEIITNVLLHQ